jgi:DNA-directed RNA polymerase subunit RPC12/RpoP
LIADDGKNIYCDFSHEDEYEEDYEEPNEMVVKRKPIKCPVCGFKPVAEILYGMPVFSQELEEEMKAGKVTLGGCDISPGQPSWECSRCGTLFYIDSDKEVL